MSGELVEITSEIAALSGASDPDSIRKIERLESTMLGMPKAEIETTAYRSAGLYAREIRIPAGTVLTGKIHKFENMNIMCGDMTVLTENGMTRLVGYHIIVSPPGTKRVAFAHAPTVWTTIHATDEMDEEKIEETFVVNSHEEYLSFCKSIGLEGG